MKKLFILSLLVFGLSLQASECSLAYQMLVNSCSGYGENWGSCIGAQIHYWIKGC